MIVVGSHSDSSMLMEWHEVSLLVTYMSTQAKLIHNLYRVYEEEHYKDTEMSKNAPTPKGPHSPGRDTM